MWQTFSINYSKIQETCPELLTNERNEVNIHKATSSPESPKNVRLRPDNNGEMF
jgi:hypothetical protein